MKQFTVELDTDTSYKFRDPYYDFLEYEVSFKENVGVGEETTVIVDISTPGESEIYGKLRIEHANRATFAGYKLNVEDGYGTILRVENVRRGQDRITVLIIHNEEPVFRRYNFVPM
jgi:hypothetical protein